MKTLVIILLSVVSIFAQQRPIILSASYRMILDYYTSKVKELKVIDEIIIIKENTLYFSRSGEKYKFISGLKKTSQTDLYKALAIKSGELVVFWFDFSSSGSVIITIEEGKYWLLYHCKVISNGGYYD